MASPTLRRVLLALLFSATWGCCSVRTPHPDIVMPEEQVAPTPPPPPPHRPDDPRGPGYQCPLMDDFCRERFLYEVRYEASPSSPGAAGAAGPSAPRA